MACKEIVLEKNTECEIKQKQTEIICNLIIELTNLIQILPKYHKKIYGYIQQFDFPSVYAATQLAFRKYYNPYGQPWEEWDSFIDALNKIGGICYNWKVQGE